eukprot:CAMPEP_0119355282 /NCGR_PEP_ID=MMETSP1334-20130426/4130_1 /TAXON_ID=127549 /ORGANISM="Calcidiscus leptoporus, Strain RCC1130" /LENGTH=219 /DNA_ID=CAMNT_0007369059 /DNA_START=15 /DNA_END=674 /DNA_ORIENTATION=+
MAVDETAAGVLIKGLTEAELDMTVEQFLKEQCKQRVATLKRHADDLIGRFEEDVSKARRMLLEAASQQSAAEVASEAAEEAMEGPSASDPGQPLCEAFAMVAIRGIHIGRIIRLEPTDAQKSWTVGRVAECDICLAGDDEVSSRHAKIHFEKKQFKLMDENSTNGTFATNGQGKTVRLKPGKNHILKENHLMSFGGSSFRWCSNTKAEEHAEYAKEMGA